MTGQYLGNKAFQVAVVQILVLAGEEFLTDDGNSGQSGLVGAAIDIRPQFYALAYIMKL